MPRRILTQDARTRMRTLVLTEFFLPAVGGSIHWLINTYSRYDPSEVLLVAPRCAGAALADQQLGFPVVRIPMTMADWDPTVPRSFAQYIRALWHVRTLCKTQGIRQIHCAKVLPEGCIAWSMQRLTAIPYLIYAHGEEILIALSSRKLAWLLPRIYNAASAVIANSGHTKALLESIGVQAAKIHVIHPGVQVSLFQASEALIQRIRHRHHLKDTRVLLTVGRLQRRKGHDTVIQALPTIRQAIPNIAYVIVGDGEEYTYLTQMAEACGVADCVIFAGRVPAEELAAYYAACEVFIMANRQIGHDIEGFGMVYLEAGAAGRPVIGGISGGTDDAILDEITGLRIDGTRVDAVAQAVVTLLETPAMAIAMGEAGRHRVAEEFSWESVVERTRSVACQLTR